MRGRMSKTNHRSDGKADIKQPSPGRDYCNGKRGERRNVAGAKKYVHSRHRANTKVNLAALAKAEEDTDYIEVMRETVYESNYLKVTTRAKHAELLPWKDPRDKPYLRSLAGRGYHEVPGKRSEISDKITDCPGCEICNAL
jgi:hypothetical protein